MEFSYNTSLTYRAVVSVLSTLWNHKSIRKDINIFILENEQSKSWPQIEQDVLSAIEKLIVPHTVKIHLKNFVQPMGMQIINWISFTRPVFKTYQHCSLSVCYKWTEIGTLDYYKTAEDIIKQNYSQKILSFCLACMFCMKEIVINLWPDVKEDISDKMVSDMYSIGCITVEYWLSYLSNSVGMETTSHTDFGGVGNACELGLHLALDSNNISSLNYFVNKISPIRKEKVILSGLIKMLHRRQWHGNILIFLFAHLEKCHITELINNETYRILASLLEWPCQQFFIMVFNNSWNYLSNSEYLNLFQDILECISNYHACNIYKELIKEFWQSSPTHFKEYVILKCTLGTFLSRLFMLRNTTNVIQMIFNECNSEQKQDMIFYFEGMNLCDVLVKKERWDSLKFLILSCIPDKEVLEDFIIHYQNYKPSYQTAETQHRTKILIQNIRQWY